MKTEIKKQIIDSAKSYAVENGLSQDVFADMVGVNVSYINALWNGNFSLKSKNNKGVEIKESYFKKIAGTIGYKYEPVYWSLVETDQYLQIYTELLDAKNSGRMKLLIGSTGCGKTYTVKQFALDCPNNTFRITVSSLHNLNDIINELCELMNITVTGSRISRLKKISAKLREIKLNGGKPILIIDEAENLRLPALKMLKALYDAVKEFCSIALIGTNQLSDKLDTLNEKNIEGMPQFYRRFKAGKREICEINKRIDFTPFLERVEDNGLRVLLESLSGNYGELNDYLEPALREADKTNVELTENEFRLMFGLGRKAV